MNIGDLSDRERDSILNRTRSSQDSVPMTLTVAPSNSGHLADYYTDGTNDQVEIQAAIDALPSAGGTVELTAGTYTTSGEIFWAKHSVVLKGQGQGATKIQTGAASYNAIRVGNKQSDGVMRNFNRIEDMTVSLAGGASSFAVIKIDGGGSGTQINNVTTNEGKYGFELMDLDRCSFSNIFANNVRTAACFMEVGVENTYGTVTFINCSFVLSDNNTTCVLMGANAGQASPNAIDRISFIGCLFYATAGLTGTKGIDAQIGVSSMAVIGCLFENPIHHVDLTGANSQICQMTFISDTFLQNSGVSTNCIRLNTLNHVVSVMDCRFQQSTNVFNGASGFSVINLFGKNNNQGNITNVFTGSFGARMGTDTVFAGDANLVTGLDNQRYDSAFVYKMSLKDGITAPGTNSGHAYIYVDTADGDLKVKFGDGVTKVIAADT